MSDQKKIKPKFADITAEIVAAYVSNNSIQSEQLPALIGNVHKALNAAASGPTEEIPSEPPKPAVPIKKSITADYLICLEDGKKYKALKRHLRSRYNMTPDEYRARWGLPSDYPMVAPSYTAARSELAKRMGLGNARKKDAATPKVAAASGGKKRGSSRA